MDEIAQTLAARLVEGLNKKPTNERIIAGLAGVPASGKSTLAQLVVQHTNALLASQAADLLEVPPAILVTQDGWHLPRSALDAMPDPKEAHDRRGAPFTFDAKGYLAFVKALRTPVTADVFAPTFDHAKKDPVYDDVRIRPQHRVVLIEGLYALLNVEEWGEAAMLLDERWFVNVPKDIARTRLVRRHRITGVAGSWEEAVWRSNTNDEPNGDLIRAHVAPTTYPFIESLEDTTMVMVVPPELLPKLGEDVDEVYWK
ncbi:P-loop containing nucleoside triphosphate hydrolase protein [Coniophora puteana RWD-64-598 SS2]|uniref:P-loop containing nucleoside triphosphate hydrolase protein n=1 Tax=Coniophora puteana (strain RWD-64-598) TaxID=741705 RepID=A0A5M3N459_CONPW|nr:P-loop containing nucleoside triphosphate hydrolase protein [Coniophora puteana RWD-64-598 SS2]EIW86173.1 P-loop containing nucleoside triphosphate hydrolase protein [Coniophora puteana RWD-64-598 SS2]